MLGGTFDPVHLGHLGSAKDVARAFDLSQVLLVLSSRPPHKEEAEQAPVSDRWQMLLLAVASEPLLAPSDVEVRRAGPSYTVDTLRELGRAEPQAELHLVIGIDAWLEVDTWSRSEQLLALAHVIVTTRPGEDFPARGLDPPVAAASACWYDSTIGCWVHNSGHRLVAHRVEGVDASSSDIRRRVHSGLSIAHLVPPAVAEYIQRHGLYA